MIDTRIVPRTDCANYARNGICKVGAIVDERQHRCVMPELPCMCGAYLGHDGETGAQRWPNLDRISIPQQIISAERDGRRR